MGRRTQNETLRAWSIFTLGKYTCPYCKHDLDSHQITYGIPHFYAYGKQYKLSTMLEVHAAYCAKCADDKHTTLSVCFFQSSGIGESLEDVTWRI